MYRWCLTGLYKNSWWHQGITRIQEAETMGKKEQNHTIDGRQANLKTTIPMFSHTVAWNMEVLGSGVKIIWKVIALQVLLPVSFI